MSIRTDPLEKRFWDKVDKTSECWLWTGSTYVTGYGQIRHQKRLIRVHRLSYVWAYGEIPEGYEIDHLCHNSDDSCLGGWTCMHRRCVNPLHLEAISKQENVKRGRGGLHQASKTHCPQGHEYTEENTIIEKYDQIFFRRHCRTCNSERTKIRNRKKRLEKK